MSRPIVPHAAAVAAAPPPTRQTLFGSLADASVSIADGMTRDVRYVRPAMRAHAVADYLRQHGEREAPVVDELGRPVGVVAIEELEAMPASRVAEAMTPAVNCLPSSASVLNAATTMLECRSDRVYVVSSDGVLAGCFSLFDLARWVLSETGHANDTATGAPSTLVPRTVRDVMRPCSTVITAGETVAEARERFDSNDLPFLPVCREGKLVGVIACADIDALAPVFARQSAAGYLDYLFVGDVMRAPPLALRADTPLQRAQRVLETTQIGCAVVELDGHVVGVLVPEDLQDVASEVEPRAAGIRLV